MVLDPERIGQLRVAGADPVRYLKSHPGRFPLLHIKDFQKPPQPRTAPGGPLDNVVREMLRPMLKQWLDDNLPEIVEQLVTREIARITGKHIR